MTFDHRGQEGLDHYDDLDLCMAMSVVASYVGCDDDIHVMECSELVGAISGRCDGLGWYVFSEEATEALARAGRPGADDLAWLEIAALPLVVDVTECVGREWEAEVEVAVDMALAGRRDKLASIAVAAAKGPVGFWLGVEAADLIAEGFCPLEYLSAV